MFFILWQGMRGWKIKNSSLNFLLKAKDTFDRNSLKIKNFTVWFTFDNRKLEYYPSVTAPNPTYESQNSLPLT